MQRDQPGTSGASDGVPFLSRSTWNAPLVSLATGRSGAKWTCGPVTEAHARVFDVSQVDTDAERQCNMSRNSCRLAAL